MAKIPKHYVDNKVFYTEMTKYISSVKKAITEGKRKPLVNDYIGKSLYDLAEKLSHRPEFQKYKFRDELVSDAIINCLQYIDNFDPEKSNNPFAYFTQISWYAFLRRIEKEKKYLYTKYKSIENTEIFNTGIDQAAGGDATTVIKYTDGARENMNDFVSKFETSMEKKKAELKERQKKKVTDEIE